MTKLLLLIRVAKKNSALVINAAKCENKCNSVLTSQCEFTSNKENKNIILRLTTEKVTKTST